LVDPYVGSIGTSLTDRAQSLVGVVCDLNPSVSAEAVVRGAAREEMGERSAAELLASCEASGWLTRGAIPVGDFERMLELRSRHHELVRRHRPARCRAPIVLCLAEQRLPKSDFDWLP